MSFESTVFAGFSLPRTECGPTIWTYADKPLAARLADWRKHGKSRGCIGRVTYPNRIRTAETASDFKGWGFYLPTSGADAMGMRWAWCDDVPGDWDDENPVPTIDHLGWFLDEDGYGDTARGIVCKLPSGRGFLAGWSMGEGMASELDCTVFGDITAAVRAADSMAENIADSEREYRATHCPECDQETDECECGEEE